MSSSKVSQFSDTSIPDYSAFLEAIGANDREREPERHVLVRPDGVLNVSPELQERFTQICHDDEIEGFLSHRGNRVLVVNGNDIHSDYDHQGDPLVSFLCGHMIRIFQNTMEDFMVLPWACVGETTYPERMIISLLGQLLSKTEIAMPVLPTISGHILDFYELVDTLKKCLEAQLGSTNICCIIDSIQHYEDGDASGFTGRVFKALVDVAGALNDRSVENPSDVREFKLLLASLGECESLTEASSVVHILNLTDIVPEQV